MTEKQFTTGDVFFRPGDIGEQAFQLVEGRVELFAGPVDRPVRISEFGPGEVFGEMSLVEERAHALTARALTAGRVTSLTRDKFEKLLSSDPARCRSYLKSLFERLRALTAQVAPTAAPAPVPAADHKASHHPVALPTSDDVPPPPRRVVLFPLTRRSAQTLPDDGLVVTKFPLRLGRVSAANEMEALDLNDLWLFDEKPFSISRNHCSIDLDGDDVVVRDRGSHLGCLVNEHPIGGKSHNGMARLHQGHNVLVLGHMLSPYQFRVAVDEEQ